MCAVNVLDKKHSDKIQKQQPIFFILITWLAVQGFLYTSMGIKPILESEKYIYAAKQLITTGTLPGIRYLFYFTTTLIIAFCLKTGLGFSGVVLIQLTINLSATIAFYKSLLRIQKRSFSALLTVLALVLCIPFQSWNFYLYTESFFYSFTLLFFSQCLQTKDLSIRQIVLQVVLLTLCVLSRPLGILLLPCWLLYLMFKSKINYKPLLLTALIIGLAVSLYITNLILGNINDWQILKPAEYQYIICDIPTAVKMDLDHLKTKPPLTQLFYYIVNYPDQFLKLVVKRLQAFFFLVRPYYSQIHNLFLIVFCLLLYIPIIVNLIHRFKQTNTKANILFALTIIICFSTAVCLQCDDYHNRFHNAIIPVFLFCGIFFLLNTRNWILFEDQAEKASDYNTLN